MCYSLRNRFAELDILKDHKLIYITFNLCRCISKKVKAKKETFLIYTKILSYLMCIGNNDKDFKNSLLFRYNYHVISSFLA